MPDDLVFQSARRLARLLATRKLSAVELLRAYIRQIERVNPKVNAIVTFRPEEALKEARAIDARRSRGAKLGPLAGLPIAYKDMVVTKGIHNKFVEALTERLKAVTVDNALKPGVQMGPVVDKNQLNQDLFYIEEGKKEGAKLAFGGNQLKRETEGFYLEPALFTDTRNDMRINREEVFGPVATVIPANDYEEALAIANDTQFGLTSGIITTSLKHASHFRRNSQAGMVMVNLPTAGVDYHVPFGGRKGSSYGPREQGRYAAEFYTTVKTAYVAAG